MATYTNTFNLDLDNDDMADIPRLEDTRSDAKNNTGNDTKNNSDTIDIGDKKNHLKTFAVKCMCIKNISDYMWVQKFLDSLPVMPITSLEVVSPTPLVYLACHDVPGVLQEYVYKKQLTKVCMLYEDKTYMLANFKLPCAYDWFQVGEVDVVFPVDAEISDVSLRYKILCSADTESDGTYTGEIPNCGVQKISHNHYKINSKFWRFCRAEGKEACDYGLKFTSNTLDLLPITVTVKNMSATLACEYLRVCIDMFNKIKLTYTKDYVELTKYNGDEVLRHDIAKLS